MKKSAIVLLLACTFSAVLLMCGGCDKQATAEPTVVTPDPVPAQPSSADMLAAFNYLNSVRANPSAYSTEIGVDLSYVVAIRKLTWNDTLARVATAKATDMAARNYFAHVDPDGNGMNIKLDEAGYKLVTSFLTDKSQNNFESLGAGYTTPLIAIKGLLLDSATTPPGHRNHLLGIVPFWSNCYDVGIGFVKGTATSAYPYYCCVIIAKHDF